MLRSGRLWISLLALTGCGPGHAAAEPEGHATTSSDTEVTDEGAQTDTEATETSHAGTETGTSDEVCELGCEGATFSAEGIVRCPDGRHNRVAGGTFDPTITEPSCSGDEDVLDCTSDVDCNSGSYGKCIHGLTVGEFEDTTWCGCVYSCASDSDCAEGSVCVPPGVLFSPLYWPQCLPAVCETNSDCGECGECGLGVGTQYAPNGGCESIYAIQCRTADDHCTYACDMGDCFPSQNGQWACQYIRCF
jgi:hypothetical protein